MVSEEIKNWIRLLNIPNIGPKTFNLINQALQLQKRSISDLFQMNKQELYRIVKQSNIKGNNKILENIWQIKEKDIEDEKIFQQLINKNVQIIPSADKSYPEKLKQKLNGAFPPLIYTFGNRSLLSSKSIAVVGKRNPTKESIYITKSAVEKAVSQGYTIVSGYAAGIDLTAHISALKYRGTTIIVLPFGILEFKWKEQFKKIENLPQRSLVISQFYPRLKWQIPLAMQRNKTILGLSGAVFGVELDKGGGTYNSISESLKIGIPTFVLDTIKNRTIFVNSQQKPFFIKDIEDLSNKL